MTRKGHCQLENIKFNLRVSHLFRSIALLMASLQNRPREAPRLVQSCSMKRGGAFSALEVYPHPDHSMLKVSLFKRGQICATRCPSG